MEQLSRLLTESPNVETVLPLLPKITSLARDDETAFESLPVVEQAAKILLPDAVEQGQWPTAANLLKLAARKRFEQAEPDKAAEHLRSLSGLYQSASDRVAGDGAASQRERWINEVALEYLRGAQTKDALDAIGEAVDLEQGDRGGFDDARAAAAGGLNRHLQQLRTDQRYELLYAWTMPTAARQSVRVLASMASVEAPPDVFARALGERPRANAFPVPDVGGVDGLFSTAWLLVRAAAESGRLRRLIAELEQLAGADVENAAHVLLLARIADSNLEVSQLRTSLNERLASLREQVAAVGTNQAPADQAASTAQSSMRALDHPLDWFVVGAACLQRDGLHETGQAVFETLLDLADELMLDHARPFLRRARAIAVLKQHEGANASLLGNPNLKLWIPASEESAWRCSAGAVREIWLAHEDHVMHLAGPHNDYLCFRFPLTGDFEFQVEAQSGGEEHTSGNLAFGGLAYEVAGNADEFRVWGLDMHQRITRPMPFVRKEPWATYQRLTLRSSEKGVQHLVNGHPVWTDPQPRSTSPWLALRCFGQHIPAFRNFRLTGTPVIPREVHMSEGNLLRGWFTQFYPNSVSPAVPLSDDAVAINAIAPVDQDVPSLAPQDPAGYDWFIRDGVIHGAQREEAFRLAAPSRLTYFRPLQNDESISYEYFYEPGKQEVHPALGRLAMLIEPSGVRVHWMTGGEIEWTGLAESNATIEPLNRRGPRPLPLQPDEWNGVTMTLSGDTLTLVLNDIEVYSRKMEPENSRRFSLYYDRSRASVRVRKVVMRGDWPERLTADDLENLLAPHEQANELGAAADQQSLGKAFDERHVTDTALVMHRRAAMLPPDERFALLADYVLPGASHDTLRLSLEFTATNPPVSAGENVAGGDAAVPEAHDGQARSRIQRGGDLACPALDLIEVAAQLGRMDEVHDRVFAAPQATDLQRRQRLALLTLTVMAKKDYTSANDLLFQLFELVEQGTHTQFAQRWPETLAAHVALREPATRRAGRELAVHLLLRQARNGADSGSEAWRRHIAMLVGLANYFDEAADPSIEQFGTAPPLQQWAVVSRATARSRGFGFPRLHWQLNDQGVERLARHDEDYLYFQSPLLGDYEVECDVPAFGWRDTQVMAAGEWVSARFNLTSYTHGNFRRLISYETVSPPFVRPTDWIHYRVVVRDGAVRHFANGRQLNERQLTQHADPWLAIRIDTPGNGAARNVWISGNPVIPEAVRLAATEELGGWLAYDNQQSVGGSEANWRHSGDVANGGIVGRRQAELAGSFVESLFRYHRPMLEDGTIQYEFYYEEGQSHCHPALDRMAMLLDPEGVRIHWITDGRYDRTALAPDNASDEPENRRGPQPLPLIHNAWNQLGLTLRGDVVQLSLNGQLIYERELDPTNQRTFGLFHFADQTEARVRTVMWRGNWPRELPSIGEQELSGDHASFLDQTLPELSARFDHDFALKGFPPDKFSIVYGSADEYSPLRDGLHIDHQGKTGYRNATFAPRLRIQGDFDIIATYGQLDFKAAMDGSASLYLLAALNNESRTECMVMRRNTLRKGGAEEQFHQTALVKYDDQGAQRDYSRAMASETNSGRLRLARRGSTAYFLWAEGDSPLFRLVRTEELTAEEISEGGLRIINQTHGPGRVRVVWNSLSIWAEKITGMAIQEASERVSLLDRQRNALPLRFAHDFTRDRVTPQRFLVWGLQERSGPSRGGLRVVGPPSDNWTSAGASPQLAVHGDFDMSFEFDLLRMTAPKDGLTSAVYLQIEIPDASQHQYSVVLVGSPEGEKYVSAQLREPSAEGDFSYPSICREFVDHVQRLRLARRGNQLYFLYGNDAGQADHLLARHEVEAIDIPLGTVKLLVHTGGSGRITEAAWQKFAIHAE